MKKSPFVIILFLSIIISFSCKFRTETLKPKVSGKAGEILLVISEHDWDSDLGNSFSETLSSEKEGLPQPEPIFDLIRVVPDQFSKIFTSHRNILIVNTDRKNIEPRITVSHDQWATPQTVINVYVTNDSSGIDFILQNSGLIIDHFNNAERERVLINYKKYQEANIVRKLKQKYHVSLYVPKGYSMDIDSADFVWLACETPRISQSVLIYFYPYNDPDNFSPDNLIKRRDQFLKRYIKGPVRNTWMTTEDILPPVFKEFKIGNRYFAEIRGLWKLENGFMGGPFVSLSTVDENRQMVVTVDGFVYAPNDDKREFLRQVESILYSLEILE
jgi:hypothetical protein